MAKMANPDYTTLEIELARLLNESLELDNPILKEHPLKIENAALHDGTLELDIIVPIADKVSERRQAGMDAAGLIGQVEAKLVGGGKGLRIGIPPKEQAIYTHHIQLSDMTTQSAIVQNFGSLLRECGIFPQQN